MDWFANIHNICDISLISAIYRCRLDEMAHHIAVNEGLETAYVPLDEKAIKEILRASLEHAP